MLGGWLASCFGKSSKTYEVSSKVRWTGGFAPVVPPDEDFLYVILPYFNYCKFQRRKQLFMEFVERIRSNPRIRIVITECKHATEREFDLPPRIPSVYLHLAFVTQDLIWIKENLINLAVQKLPERWKYMAWVDADISFMQQDWAETTMDSLDTYDVVQMFQTCVNLGPTGEALKIDQSFGYMHVGSGQPYHKTARYGFWHPGFAWACTRQAYETMGGLVDFAILGSGDRHMALALIHRVDDSYPSHMTNSYKRRLQDFQDRCMLLKLGYVPGTILHHWHGRLVDRRYVERWTILTKGEYMPSLDVFQDKNGLLQLTQRGKRLSQPLSEYFAGRQEDNMTV
jgi:hypothetical protein